MKTTRHNEQATVPGAPRLIKISVWSHPLEKTIFEDSFETPDEARAAFEKYSNERGCTITITNNNNEG